MTGAKKTQNNPKKAISKSLKTKNLTKWKLSVYWSEQQIDFSRLTATVK